MGVEKIAVAISGGVDSLGALLLLKARGFEVFALHGRLHDSTPEDGREPGALRALCKKLNVPLHIIDLRSQFAKLVIDPFIQAWSLGHTPNPCAICNRRIKFGLLAEIALKMGASRYATGHYAALASNPYSSGLLLAPAADRDKDQNYFLARIRPEFLPRLLFPCARLQKSQIRDIVHNAALAPLQEAESQDICFSGASWRDFARCRMDPAAPARKPGAVLLRQSNGELKHLGTHSGLWQFTNGQRRGLGFHGCNALHVLEKRPHSGELVLGSREMLGMTGLRAGKCVFFTPPELWPKNIFVRARFRQVPEPAKIEFVNNSILARFLKPVFPSASGQILALQDEQGHILAGAVIEEIMTLS